MILKSMLITIALTIVITLIARWAVGNYTPEAKSLYSGGETLAQCPDSPNCVSSTFSDDSHHFAAIKGSESAFKMLKTIIGQQEHVTIISDNDTYLHAEFHTKLLSYVDDLELLHIKGSGEIQLRSASRLGKSDFGVNRKRLQTLINLLP